MSVAELPHPALPLTRLARSSTIERGLTYERIGLGHHREIGASVATYAAVYDR